MKKLVLAKKSDGTRPVIGQNLVSVQLEMAFLHTQMTQSHHYSFSASSPSPTADLLRCQNVLRRHDLTMPLIDLTLRRITANRSNFRFNQATESLSIAGQFASTNHPTMAEQTNNKDASQWKKSDAAALSVAKSAEKKDKDSDKSTPVVPPPEKPLPGDCCGSGCVRCVWDVYYEELEEYNKLQKADS